MRHRLRDPAHVFDIRWLTLIPLCLSLSVIGIDNTILNVALPTLARPESQGGLSASGSELQWIVDSYVLVFAGLLLTAGSLGDRFGRYRALTLGMVVFGAGSALSGFAGSPSTLIAARVVMAVGAAFIMPATLSIITNVFTVPRERARAIGIWAGVAAVGVGLGPLIGGILLEHFWWGSVFLINVPVVLATLLLAFLWVPESRDPSAPRLDIPGALLSIVGLTALLWAIIEGPNHGWTSSTVLGAFTLGVVLLGAFVVWERTCPHPMLDLRFFRNPRFSAASFSIMVMYFALFGMSFLVTQYIQAVLGYSTIQAGLLGLPMVVLLASLAPRSPRLAARFGAKRVIAGGMFVCSVAMALMTTFEVNSSVVHVILVTMLMGVGMAHLVAPATESIMGSVPREKAGVGSAMNDTTRQVGGAIGVAVFGSVVASQFSPDVAKGLAGIVPARVVETAKESIGAAVAVARSTPAASDRIADVANAAFVSGMHSALLIGSAAFFIGGLVVAVWLPAHAEESDGDHATIADAASGITAVDVIPIEPIVTVVEEIEYEHEHR